MSTERDRQDPLVLAALLRYPDDDLDIGCLQEAADLIEQQAAEIARLRRERDEAMKGEEEADTVLGNVCESLRGTAERLGLLDHIPDLGSLRSDAAAWDAHFFEKEITRLRRERDEARADRSRLTAIVERLKEFRKGVSFASDTNKACGSKGLDESSVTLRSIDWVLSEEEPDS